jgi:hypothetical protein
LSTRSTGSLNTNEQLDWNVHYESLAVHARVLFEFLTNEPDSRNLKASDFVGSFRVDKTALTSAAFQKFHSQVLHPGKRRPSALSGKMNLEDCKLVVLWLKTRFAEFIARLDEPYRSQWSWDRARVPRSAADTLKLLPSDPQASNAIINDCRPAGWVAAFKVFPKRA